MIKRVLMTLVLLGLPALAAAQQNPPAGFTPFDENAPRETLPFAPLVFIAYSVAWTAVAVYVFTLWRKSSKIEQDLADLRRGTKR